MREPNLRFKIDLEFDQWTAKEFLTFDESDIFSNSILEEHTELNKYKNLPENERGKFLNGYVSNFYKKHRKELEEKAEKASKDWAKIYSRFYELVNRLFLPNKEAGYEWPEGNYICFLSIFNCNPRFIKDKFFQAYYKHKETINYVCMHEMLHFVFYDYMEKNLPDEVKKLGEGGMWKLSEIFNDVIFRQPDFVTITKQNNPTIYAQSQEELRKHTNLWDKNPDTNSFVQEYLKQNLPS